MGRLRSAAFPISVVMGCLLILSGFLFGGFRLVGLGVIVIGGGFFARPEWNPETDKAVALLLVGSLVAGLFGFGLFAIVAIASMGDIGGFDDPFIQIVAFTTLAGSLLGIWLIAKGIRILWRNRPETGSSAHESDGSGMNHIGD